MNCYISTKPASCTIKGLILLTTNFCRENFMTKLLLSKTFLATLLLSCVCFIRAEAQGGPQPIQGDYKNNFVQGNLLIDENNWPMALAYFKEAYQVDSSNANINYKVGLCYLNSFSEKKKSLGYLRKASKDVSRNYDPTDPRMKKAPENTFYYLAQSYHLNYEFDSAIMYFESWKAIVGTKDAEMAHDCDKRIGWAKNAKEFMASP